MMTPTPTPAATPAPDPREELFADGAMSIAAAVEFVGLSQARLYDLMVSGALPYTHVGGRRLIAKRSLMKLLAAHLVGDPDVAAPAPNPTIPPPRRTRR